MRAFYVFRTDFLRRLDLKSLNQWGTSLFSWQRLLYTKRFSYTMYTRQQSGAIRRLLLRFSRQPGKYIDIKGHRTCTVDHEHVP